MPHLHTVVRSRCSQKPERPLFTVHCSLFTLLLALLIAGCGKSQPAGDAQPAGAPSPASAPAAAAAIQTITTTGGVEMVLLPAGEFTMGDNQGSADEKPARAVKVDSFLIDKYEVVQKFYENLMGKNPSKYKAENQPVEQVSWFDAVRFCNLRSMREGLTPCYDEKTFKCNFDANGYRLPTEAEWEYACRAGTSTKYSFGNSQADLSKHGWSKENSDKTTHPVGGKAANPWGLFDMYGNVAEWCNDFYAKTAYQGAESANPKGPAEGEECVLRGGSWNKSADSCRSASRASETPRFADTCFGADTYGFRCVRKAPSSP